LSEKKYGVSMKKNYLIKSIIILLLTNYISIEIYASPLLIASIIAARQARQQSIHNSTASHYENSNRNNNHSHRRNYIKPSIFEQAKNQLTRSELGFYKKLDRNISWLRTHYGRLLEEKEEFINRNSQDIYLLEKEKEKEKENILIKIDYFYKAAADATEKLSYQGLDLYSNFPNLSELETTRLEEKQEGIILNIVQQKQEAITLLSELKQDIQDLILEYLDSAVEVENLRRQGKIKVKLGYHHLGYYRLKNRFQREPIYVLKDKFK
jgi:hypothetical protein